MFSEDTIRLLNAKLENILGSLSYILPEVFLGIGILLVVVLDLILKRKHKLTFTLISVLLLAFTFVLVVLQFYSLTLGKQLFLNLIYLDKISIYFKALVLLAGILTVLMSFPASVLRDNTSTLGEYFVFVLSLVLGLQILTMSSNMLLIYLALEFVSITSYLISIFYFDQKSSKSSLNYLLFGALSSGLMLYGMSLLYGLTGTLDILNPLFLKHLSEADSFAVWLAFIMSISGFLFKLSAVPFQLWTPDIYENAPTPVVAFFSAAPKAIALLLLLRFSFTFTNVALDFGETKLYWNDFLALLALSSILVGNLSALYQDNIKRLLAYSSIAHAGFLLIAVVVLDASAVPILLFYIFVYILMNFGVFTLAEGLALNSPSHTYSIKSYSGLGLKYPFLSILFLIFLLALVGLPPTAGFTAKLLIFSYLWQSYEATLSTWYLALFVIGLLNTALSLFYYLKIPFYLFFRQNDTSKHFFGKVKIPILYSILGSLLAFCLLFLFFKSDIFGLLQGR